MHIELLDNQQQRNSRVSHNWQRKTQQHNVCLRRGVSVLDKKSNFTDIRARIHREVPFANWDRCYERITHDINKPSNLAITKPSRGFGTGTDVNSKRTAPEGGEPARKRRKKAAEPILSSQEAPDFSLGKMGRPTGSKNKGKTSLEEVAQIAEETHKLLKDMKVKVAQLDLLDSGKKFGLS
ncbi:hypothetical protein LTR08_007043 [Meristemomyces frigidus]|nr:hypothetical protein LTR08_007043 [Meristemomyces frigidus]